MGSDYSIIITTCPEKDSAKSIAKLLINNRLAACVQMFPIESMYIWQDRVFDENEIMLFIKTKKVLLDKISALIKKHHTYDVPEIIQIPITGGLPQYMRWIEDWVD